MSIRTSHGKDLYRAGDSHLFMARHQEWATPGTDPLVVFSTGYTGSATLTNTYANYGHHKFMRTLVQFGLAVMSIDAGGIDTFGNDTAIAAVGNAVSWIRTAGSEPYRRLARSGPVVLVGTSMGFMDLLAWARVNQVDVAAAIGLFGAVDLTAGYNRADVTMKADIDAAYGGTYVPATHEATHSPMAYAASLGFPILYFHSPTDTLVPSAEAAAFVDAVPNGIFVGDVGMDGHSTETIAAAADRAELVAFIEANL